MPDRERIQSCIAELLFSHQCLVLPGFGGLITNFKPGGFENERLVLSPPSRTIAFNVNLKVNDGLLASHWAHLSGKNYPGAMKDIEDYVEHINSSLQTGRNFEMQGIGTFYKSPENTLVFIPRPGINFLDSSFGLFPIKLRQIASLSAAPTEEKAQHPSLTKTEKYIIANAGAVSKNSFPVFRVAATLIVFMVFLGSLVFLTNSGPVQVFYNRKNNEQPAGILNPGSTITPQKVRSRLPQFAGFSSEKRKLQEIKQVLGGLPDAQSSTNTIYQVRTGPYKTMALANRQLNQLLAMYPGARLDSSSTTDIFISVEVFYKHTSASDFCVILRQNGFKNAEVFESKQ